IDEAIAKWALAEVRRIARETVSGHPVEIYLFGSWARGDASRTSDIDLAIVPKGPIPKELLATLRERLEESTVPYRVDVVNLDEVDGDFRSRVLQEAIRW